MMYDFSRMLHLSSLSVCHIFGHTCPVPSSACLSSLATEHSRAIQCFDMEQNSKISETIVSRRNIHQYTPTGQGPGYIIP